MKTALLAIISLSLLSCGHRKVSAVVAVPASEPSAAAGGEGPNGPAGWTRLSECTVTNWRSDSTYQLGDKVSTAFLCGVDGGGEWHSLRNDNRGHLLDERGWWHSRCALCGLGVLDWKFAIGSTIPPNMDLPPCAADLNGLTDNQAFMVRNGLITSERCDGKQWTVLTMEDEKR